MKRVLVIDDTKASRRFMAECLQNEGYEVVTLGNGREGIELLQSKAFDLIILDMKMPFMSGMEVLRWIRKNSIYIPVAVVTAYGTVKNAIECMENDVIAYIQKPFSMNRFKQCIDDIEKKLQNKYEFKNKYDRKITYNLNEIDSDTEYAIAERMSDEIILNQVKQITQRKEVHDIFEFIPYSIVVLNKERQIIYSNMDFLELLGVKFDQEVIGFRLGEILKCINANKTISGCGTTKQCSVCGAVNAIIESQKEKTTVNKECSIILEGKIGIELSVSAMPVKAMDDGFTILIIREISNEKRKERIEQIFYHDLLNALGSIKGLADCAENSLFIEENDLINCISETANNAIEQIKDQAELTAAEKGNLQLNISRFSLKELVNKLILNYNIISVCEIELNCKEDFIIESDKTLVQRVVNNMLKNAVEDSEKKTVEIILKAKDSFVEIQICNKKWIPENIQLQLFKRSFSTKGKNRGVGTYSMKLIGEEYLKGYIKFTSKKDSGTKFIFGVPFKSEVVLL